MIKNFLLFFPLPFALTADVRALYLSWYFDPSTTMTIQWHTDIDEMTDLTYRPLGSEPWQPASSTSQTIENTRIQVHQTHLKTLTPDTEYEFRISGEPKIHRFRTMPSTLSRPITFIVGGDLFSSRKLFRKMAETVLSHDPDFIVLGGNIAHAISQNPFQLRSTCLRHWLAFLSDWKNFFCQSNKRAIPFLIVPGNEDIQSDRYDLFFSLFAFPEKQLYRAVRFGDYLSLFLLDTGHFHPIDGPQSYWLAKTLPLSQEKYRMAVYHEAAYPSFDSYFSSTAKKIRTDWSPLFERFHIQAAFEHHNRSFKRTHPLKEGKIDDAGVVYLGDGCWGAEAQSTRDQWYLAQKGRRTSVWVARLTPDQAHLTAIDRVNEPIDALALPPMHGPDSPIAN